MGKASLGRASGSGCRDGGRVSTSLCSSPHQEKAQRELGEGAEGAAGLFTSFPLCWPVQPVRPMQWPPLRSCSLPALGPVAMHSGLCPFSLLFILFLFLKTYLFIYDRQRERGRDTGRRRIRLHVRSPTRDSIPGLQDCALGQRQVLYR